MCPRRSSSEARINPRRRRWSVRWWFTAAENLWSRSFRRVPPVWGICQGTIEALRERERKGKKGGNEVKRGGGKREKEREKDMEGYRGWKDSTFINIAIVRAPRAVFFIPYLLSRLRYTRTIVHFRGAICDRLAPIRGREKVGRRREPSPGLTSETIPRHGGTSRFDARVRCRVKRIGHRRETVTRPLLYGLHTWSREPVASLSIFRRDFWQIVMKNWKETIVLTTKCSFTRLVILKLIIIAGSSKLNSKITRLIYETNSD